ncbi:glycoside hydrolase family 3 C-terminal domain-containing protein [Actinomadura fulvescens]|uniref:Glycoside hydrolase family 3 C-terminal domain-containing protein n=1 Tax=Actinomadura fulvescens TaxID=46160 RepID=A0ABN3PH78_9ACTN
MSPPDEPSLDVLPLEDKVALLTGTGMWTLRGEPRLGLPALMCANGPVGVPDLAGREVVGPAGTPVAPLPCPAALGATWDPELAWRAGRRLGAQARRAGVHMVLAPGLDLQADPLAGRHFECLGADPLLVARLGVALVRGIQSSGVAACVKHFVGNEAEDGRYTRDVPAGDELLRGRWLRPFEAAVREGGAWAVMAAYNSVNGTRMTEHTGLLRDVLKDEWGFDGVVVSDWGATVSTVDSALAGLDLVMPGPWGPWGDALVDAVREGFVPESEIDDKVVRLLRLGRRVTDPSTPVPGEDPGLGRLIATRSFVLLTNRNEILPLDAGRIRSIALIGEPATTPCLQGGGSSEVAGPPAVSPATALAAGLPHGVDLRVLGGVPIRTEPRPLPEAWTPGGFRVGLRDADGAPLEGSEGHAPAGTEFAWPVVPANAAEAVVTFTMDGPRDLAVAGLGLFSVAVDGTTVADTELTADLAALLAGFRRPPYFTVPIRGNGARVEIRHVVSPGGPAAFGLGHCPPPAEGDPGAGIAAAVRAAHSTDIAIVMVGTCAEQETEGRDRTFPGLPGRQDELVAAVAAANPRTVVVVNAGAPIPMPWAGDVAAVLWTWFGGQEYGPALADVLLGAAEPGGRLPCPIPPFRLGHGLGYTTWACTETPGGGGTVRRFWVTNTGARPGREVVRCHTATGDVAGFAAVELRPGERREVMIEVPRDA